MMAAAAAPRGLLQSSDQTILFHTSLKGAMPLYTRAWVAANPELFLQLARPPETCDICYEPFSEDSPALSPLLGERATTCRHFACGNCWCAIMNQPDERWRCHICRVDVHAWLCDTFEEVDPMLERVSMPDIMELLRTAMRLLKDNPEFLALAHRCLSPPS